MTPITDETIATMHMREWNWSRRQRFWLASMMEREIDPRRELADQIEADVCDRLTQRGYVCVPQPHKQRFDLLCNGIRVEVKAARWDGGRYSVNMHGNEADAIVIACVDEQPPVYFVAPFELMTGIGYFKIRQRNPRDYVGRLMRFYEAWDVIDEMVAAGVNAWQPALGVA